MGLFSWFRNGVNAALGRKQEFEVLLKENDVGRAIAQMTDNSKRVGEALKVYETKQHDVMKRPKKAVFGKKDPATGERKFLRWEEKWKIPIPYPVFINEIALVFLYGRPLKWIQSTKGTDRAFSKYLDFLKHIRFDAKIREAKRLAGAETQSALLFHTFQNDDGKADVTLTVLAKSLGDDIYFMKDQFRRMIAFARGYYLQEGGGEVVYHVDIYTSKIIYNCKRRSFGWEREEEINRAGKIPVILFEQEAECAEVEPMIKRKEWMVSRRADVNDRFSDPALVADSEIINSLPEKGEDSKLFILKPTADGTKKPEVRYLTWDNSPENQKQEGEELDEKIHRFSFTPKLDMETIKGLSNVSAKALRQLMILAVIKADKHKERHDEYANRIFKLSKAIISNVLDISLKAEFDALEVTHEFQEPFGEDIEALINNMVRMYNAGGMSQETLIEMNPLIKDNQAEKERIQREHETSLAEEKERNKMDTFGMAE